MQKIQGRVRMTLTSTPRSAAAEKEVPADVAGYRGSGNTLEQYPLLPEVLGMSAAEATHYQLGDVTCHHGLTVHGSINNTTNRDRMSYLFAYFPADTRYWHSADGAAVNGLPRRRVHDNIGQPGDLPAAFARHGRTARRRDQIRRPRGHGRGGC